MTVVQSFLLPGRTSRVDFLQQQPEPAKSALPGGKGDAVPEDVHKWSLVSHVALAHSLSSLPYRETLEKGGDSDSIAASESSCLDKKALVHNRKDVAETEGSASVKRFHCRRL